MKNDHRSLAQTQLHSNSVLDIIGGLSAFWLLAAQCWTFGIMCGKGYYDTQRWGNSHNFCSVGKFAWLLEQLEQEASRCAEMLITKGQACAHHDIIKHNWGLIYLRAVMSLILSAESQRTERVRGSNRFAQVVQVLCQGRKHWWLHCQWCKKCFSHQWAWGMEWHSSFVCHFQNKALMASLAGEERRRQSSGQLFRPP